MAGYRFLRVYSDIAGVFVVRVQRLEAAKQLLDADLIRAGDYEATKAKLLSKLTDDDAWN